MKMLIEHSPPQYLPDFVPSTKFGVQIIEVPDNVAITPLSTNDPCNCSLIDCDIDSCPEIMAFDIELTPKQITTYAAMASDEIKAYYTSDSKIHEHDKIIMATGEMLHQLAALTGCKGVVNPVY